MFYNFIYSDTKGGKILIVGIVGGMGSLAGLDFTKKIVLEAEALSDQEHLHIILDNNPKIPDRTAAILGKGPSPVCALTATCRRLENIGVNFIILACNTSYYFLQSIQKEVNTPIINVPMLVTKYISTLCIDKVGILATDGIIHSGLYKDLLFEKNIELVTPSRNYQELCMKGIYEIKKNNIQYGSLLLKKTVNHLVSDKDCDFILAGCTEVPIAFDYINGSKIIDPAKIISIHLKELTRENYSTV